MRLGFLIAITIAFFGTFASADEKWDVDSRCTSRKGARQTFGRPNEPGARKRIDGHKDAVKPNKNLRAVDRTRHRRLDIFNFQVKMYWEEGYCWQDEWDEREWCLECEGSDCGEDDHLWVKKCDDDEDEQRFTYEIVNETIHAVKIKPLNRQDLCWTRTEINKHQLKPCGDHTYTDEVTGLDRQVIIGFKESGRFEMHPNGFDDETNPNNAKCMSTHHHPKNEEIVKAEFCFVSRHDNSNRWILLDAEGPSQTLPPTPSSGGATPAPTPLPTKNETASPAKTPTTPPTKQPTASPTEEQTPEGGRDEATPPPTLSPTEKKTASPTSGGGGGGGSGGSVGPHVTAVSGSYCTPSAPCPQCYGDCDTDEDCQGNLQCFQRDGGQEVPSCSGGKDSLSDTDYCIDPSWDDVTIPAQPTASPTIEEDGTHTENATALPSASPTEKGTVSPIDTPELNGMGADYCSETNQCGLCEGDCDTDDDCEEGLICYIRDAYDNVPGCKGNDSSLTDYCILPK